MDPRPTVSASIVRPLRRRRLVSVCAGAMVGIALTLLVVSLALAATPSFTDVPTDHPYYGAITDLASRGVIGGYPDGTFRPDSPVLRQHFAKMIVLSLGFPVSDADVCTFTDVQKSLPGSYVNPSDTNYPDHYVAVCAAHTITVGYPGGLFKPYDNITRQQLITMVVRAAGLPDPPSEYVPSFSAGQFSLDEHYRNARKAEYAGLLDGLEGLGPAYNFLAPASRGECAQLLHNLIVYLTPATTTSSTTTTTIPEGHFENMGGYFTSGPAVSEHLPVGSGWLVVYARGVGNALWFTECENGEGTFYPWARLGESLASDPATATRGDVWSGIFWRGNDNAIWYKGWSGSEWLSRRTLGGTFTSGPAVAMMSGDRVDVFARGTDNTLRHNTGTGASGWKADWSWTGWENLGGVLASDPAAVSWGTDRIDVFARGADNALVHIWWDGSTWSEWENLGGTLSTGPGAASWGNGRLDVFAGGPGDSLRQKWYSAGTWSDWVNLGGAITSDPDAVSVAPNSIDVFVRGIDNDMLHTWWDGSSWRP
jgi:hypothetical protein